ncbi:MAG: hypothetical protein EZS28_001376 [Streblomastix strix]|uniref:Uncharacterized protein n=1 Tax=Streblomastix strix TaxID=222440 RepID=A0A5J4X788_9EUKA|nr:MAG: hypothetical protein EZS28_001376 [Streblomastix strix]
MAQSEAHVKDVIQIHDETLFRNSRYRKVGLVEQVKKFNQHINILQNIPQSYDKEQLDTLLLLKADKTDIIDAYFKTEDDALLLLKADKLYTYSKTETDTMIDEKADKSELFDACSKIEDDSLLLLKAYKLDTYSKTEDDAFLLLKANIADIVDSYSKTETDTLLDVKANIVDIVDSYSKTETDALINAKADKFELINSYSKTKDDILLDGKVEKTDLTNYVDLTSVQTFSGSKQFNIISVATVLKQNKNNVSILLAGGGDMLVSAATGSGSTTTDISIDGKSLLPTKSTTFVTTGFDQSITGIMTFTSTVISSSIQYLEFNKNSVFLAGGEVRSISDINATHTRVSYTKGEGDTLVFAKAYKTQLIDSYANSLLNDKANTGVSYAKGEDDALSLAKTDKTQLIDSYTKTEDNVLQLLKADKTQLINTYTKIETNNLLNNKTDIGVSYTKGEDDILLFAKANKIQLIDSYTKTETNNQQNDKANQSTTYIKTEPDQLISQIDAGDVDSSNYYTKTKTYELLDEKADTTDLANYVTLGTAQTITANKTFNNICRFVSSIDGMSTVTRSSFIKSGAGNTIVILGAGCTKPISDEKNTNQSITGSKTFTSNVNVSGFVKTGKDDTSVLLAHDGDRLLSSFGGIEGLSSSAFSGNYNAGTFNPDYLVTHDTTAAIYIPFPNSTIEKGGYVMITHSNGLMTLKLTFNTNIQCASATWLKVGQLCYLFLNHTMSNVHIDEALLDAAGLSEFPELQAYIHDERQQRQIVCFSPSPPTPITPIFITAEAITIPLYRLAQPLLPYNINDGGIKLYKLRNKVVYNIGLYVREDFMGFLFTSFPKELLPFSKHALVLGDDGGYKQNIMGYISEKGFYIGSSIGSVDQITPIKRNTHIAIAGVYYTDYEPLKRAVNDVNDNGKINIVDDQHANFIIDGIQSMSWEQYVVQKQTEAIGDGVQPYYPIPLELHILLMRVQYVRLISKLKLIKFFPIKTSFASFAGMKQINGNDTSDVVVNQSFGYYPMDLRNFSGSYLIDLQTQESNQNIITSNGQPISHIDSVIMQHDTFLSVPIPPSVFPQYTITEVSRHQLLLLAYTPYDLDTFKIYIIDDTVNKLIMFNMLLRQKGFIEIKQYVLNMGESIDPKRTLLFPVMILYDFNTESIQDIPSAYLTIGDTDNPVRWYIHIQSELKADKFVNYYISGSYFNSFLSIVLTANVQFDNKFEGCVETYKDGTVLFI